MSANDTTDAASAAQRRNSSRGGGWWKKVQSTVQTTVATKQEEIAAARQAKEMGKVWDPEKKEWAFYFIDVELEEVEKLIAQEDEKLPSKKGSAGNLAAGAEQKKVADREYYDLMEVDPAADESTIRKAYFKKARTCHPDKHPDDPQAAERFQTLGHAYQILSDPQKRAAYDKNGKTEQGSASESMDQIDPSVFFNVMFGSTLIEPYVGELWIASMSSSMMSGDDGLMEGIENADKPVEELTDEEREERHRILSERMETMQEQNKLKQRLRQIKIAQNIRRRIADYSVESTDHFVQEARAEAVKIASGAYGSVYLMTIGFALRVSAEEFLGFENSFLGLGGHMARTRKNVSAVGTNFKLLGAGLKAVGAGTKAMQEAEKMQEKAQQGSQVDEEAAAEMVASMESSLPTFLELAWAVNKRDITKTLGAVCRKVFQDASVPKEDRIIRAKAVRKLGAQFQLVGRSFRKQEGKQMDTIKDKDDIKARFTVATMATMAKAQGQEISEQDAEDMLQQAKQMSAEEQEQQQQQQQQEHQA